MSHKRSLNWFSILFQKTIEKFANLDNNFQNTLEHLSLGDYHK